MKCLASSDSKVPLSIRLPRSTELKPIEHNYSVLNSDKLYPEKTGIRLNRKHFIDARLLFVCH